MDITEGAGWEEKGMLKPRHQMSVQVRDYR